VPPQPAVPSGTESRSAEGQPAPAATVARSVVGTILKISNDGLSVRDLSEGRGGRFYIRLAGGPDVAVDGLKKSWQELQKGDLVIVTFGGDPVRARGIRVLPLSAHPAARAALSRDRYTKPRGREFIGWIKQVDAQTLVLRTPDGPPGTRRKGGIKTFVRHDGTVVERARSAWEELKKGDRVTVQFSKGDPSPADRVMVTLRGGQKPLPPGVATRLFDPAYDRTVKDVDGIGEWPPGKPWPPTAEESTESSAAPAVAPAPAQ
jgi:hypothetical protein